jgi:hypothetical protein
VFKEEGGKESGERGRKTEVEDGAAVKMDGGWGWGVVTAHCNGELKSDRRGNNPRRSWINPSLTMQIRSLFLSGTGELGGFLSSSEKIKRFIFLAWTGNIGNRCGFRKVGRKTQEF